MEKKGTCASPAMAFARRVFPVPGGPTSRMPFGILPPIARLTRDQALYYFLSGFTAKLAGTETGIVDPVSTFSRFFGGPFMPLEPSVYAKLLGKKVAAHDVNLADDRLEVAL